MNSKLKLYALCLSAALLSLETFAASKTQGFQVAVVEFTPGAKEIIKGDYKSGLEKISKRQPGRRTKFDLSLGQCAANIMINEFAIANTLCTEAIKAYQDRLGPRDKYLKSIAYSNRGVAKYLQGDADGASDDFNLAAEIDDNRIVKSNLANLKKQTILE